MKDLGDLIGVGKATVSKWENHEKGTPDIELDVFFDLAKALEVDARELATGKPPPTGEIAPNLRTLVEEYSAIDKEISEPIRSLIRKLAEQAKNAKPPRTGHRQKTKRMTTLERDA